MLSGFLSSGNLCLNNFLKLFRPHMTFLVFTLHQFLVADHVLKFAKRTVNKTQRMNTTELPNPQRDVK